MKSKLSLAGWRVLDVLSSLVIVLTIGMTMAVFVQAGAVYAHA